MAETKSVEDELFELLNSPDPVLPTKTAATDEAPNSAFALTSASFEDSQDFLSWLDDTSPTKILSAVKQAQSSTEASLDSNLLSSLEELIQPSGSGVGIPTEQSKTTSTADDLLDDTTGTTSNVSKALESIYDEMFGATAEEVKPVAVVTPAAVTSSLPQQPTNAAFEADVEKILSSPFPDVGRLRELIDTHGYIPNQHRLQVLLLLLSGSCHVDEEADRFSVSATEREFYRELVTDAQSLIKACYPPHGVAPQVTLQSDLTDVIILYCQRRSIDYKNIFGRLLMSIFGDGSGQAKSLISSCFYAIMSDFLPLVGLEYAALDLATDAIHTWLRLLVIYHSPSLAQHLDRVLPGWEKKAKEMTVSQNSKMSAFNKANSALDSLEKELGIDLGFDFESDALGNTSHSSLSKSDDRSIASAPPKSATNNGMIHSHWLTTFFAGSLPAAQSAMLLDWALFNGERYAGVYLMASLLEIHAAALEQMNAPQLQQFFDTIASSPADWFTALTTAATATTAASATTVGTTTTSTTGSASSFTEAWIHATTVLINNTPRAFRNALLRTETWATMAAERRRHELSTQMKSLKEQSKALLAMDDVENDNFFETALDEPLHGSTSAATGTGSGTSQQPPSKGAKKPTAKAMPNELTETSSPFDPDEDDDLMEDAKPTHYGSSNSGIVSVDRDDDDDEDDDDDDDREDDDYGHSAAGTAATASEGAAGRGDGDDAAARGVGSGGETVSSVARRASTLLMDNLRSFTAKLSATAAASASGMTGGGLLDLPRGPQHYPPSPPSTSGAGGGRSSDDDERFAQDYKLGVETSCLWTEAAEVIPSVCGSQRRQGRVDLGGSGVRVSTDDGDAASNSGSGGGSGETHADTADVLSAQAIEDVGLVRAIYQHRLRHPRHRRCFFLSANGAAAAIGGGGVGGSSSVKGTTNGPCYFAIDCRAAEEKHLGLFPKAYAVEPELITDGEAMSHLLTVLAPLKNTTHIAIIGAGDAWHRFTYRRRHPRKYARAITRPPHQEPLELRRLLEEGRNQAHAIALFLIKRGFRFISVVDGGFVAAVEVLNRPDSRFSLQTSLVDSDRASLMAVLGVQEAAVATTTERAMPATAHQQPSAAPSSSSTPPPSSLLMSSSAAALAMSHSFAVQHAQTHAVEPPHHHTTAEASATATASAASTSSTNTAGANAAALTAATAALSKNVGSLLSTWVSTATTAASSEPSSSSSSSSATSAGTIATAAASSTTGAGPGAGAASAPATTSAFAGWGSSLVGKGLDTLKKGWGVTANLATAAAASAAASSSSAAPASAATAAEHNPFVKDPSTSFIIGDNDDDDDDGHRGTGGGRSTTFADSQTIGVTRTDQERAQALALHRLAGLKKGDFVRITRDELPGAILFPCIKMKLMTVATKKPLAAAATTTTSLLDFDETTEATETVMVEQEIPVSRYLVITRERFIVLDTNIPQASSSDNTTATGADSSTSAAGSSGSGSGSSSGSGSGSGSGKGGVGAMALVKSNHHLTELIKMTFKKKDPELVTLYLLSQHGEPKPRQYRVVKYRDFVATLQKNMERFKI